jgi:CheY-like chemotaxis protein
MRHSLCTLAYSVRRMANSGQTPKLLAALSSPFARNLDYVKSVLLADDSATVRARLRELFEQSGWSVCGEVSDGQDAVITAQRLQPDLIVLDLSMPNMNGLSAGRVLKGVLPKTPLILFTSFASILSPTDLERGGFSALVDKSDAGALLTTAQSLVEAG